MTRLSVSATTHLAGHHDRCECEPKTLATPWKAQLCTILHEPDETRRRQLLDQFLDGESKTIGRVLTRAKRTARLRWEDDDVTLSYFGEALLRMVHQRWQAKDGAGTSPVFNYTANLPMILEAETRSCLREDRRHGLLDGTAGMPGASTRDRKASHVATSRQLFEVEHAHPPTVDQLITFHNDRMRATRKDAARQGVLITRDDLHEVRPVPLDDALPVLDAHHATSAPADAGSLNWTDRICEVIARCEVLDQERERSRTRRLKRAPVWSADVARVYFGQHAIGEFPLRREILERLHVAEPAARREFSARFEEVLAVARDVFTDYLHTA